jgi:hypothetical protein
MTFSPEVVTAVLSHMNEDHSEDSVLICRALGGTPDATAARMSGLDNDAAYFEATVGQATVDIRIPFSERLTERPQIRAEVTRMYAEACARLGLPARPH